MGMRRGQATRCPGPDLRVTASLRGHHVLLSTSQPGLTNMVSLTADCLTAQGQTSPGGWVAVTPEPGPGGGTLGNRPPPFPVIRDVPSGG